MKIVEQKVFDEERALYGSTDIVVKGCIFDGPMDGESALKESSSITVEKCYFNLRYPFWHDKKLEIIDSELTEKCRAALWYSENVQIKNSKLHGIKALRECSDVNITDSSIISQEFGWYVRRVNIAKTHVVSEYFMMQSSELNFQDVELKGKYSFQYITDSVFENCVFDTKDAFWHAKNVIVKDCTIKGEYLAWYSENITFINCKIIGTQPLCYCKKLKLKNCEMIDADLCFERSEVEATITAPVISIKNPLSGFICVPEVKEIIKDDPNANGEILVSCECI